MTDPKPGEIWKRKRSRASTTLVLVEDVARSPATGRKRVYYRACFHNRRTIGYQKSTDLARWPTEFMPYDA